MSSSSNLNWNSSIKELFPTKKIPKSVEHLEAAGIKNLKDLIWTFPLKHYPVKENPDLNHCNEGDFIRINAYVNSLNIRPVFTKKIRLFNISCTLETENGAIKAHWFNCYPNIKEKIEGLHAGKNQIWFEGVTQSYASFLQLVNPKIYNQSLDAEEITVYPKINKIRSSFLEGAIKKIPQTVYESTIEIQGLYSLAKSLLSLHNLDDTIPLDKAIERVKIQEFIWDQLKFAFRKNLRKQKKSAIIECEESQLENFIKKIPYPLTGDQLACIEEIKLDLKSGFPLNRLIQGDVGCGKTTIALISSFILTSSGMQTAIMAPTENLANQIFKTIKSFFPSATLLTGSIKLKDRKEILAKISSKPDLIVVGTHALFQDTVIFNNLGLCIIDEQHKFGVKQRLKLLSKSKTPNCILMTATPIPRSLRLSQFGDLEVSIIKQMPAKRKGYKTRLVEPNNLENFYSFLLTRLKLGEQAYIVLPNIETSEIRNTVAIEDILKRMQRIYPAHSIAQIHGQMSAEDQAQVLDNFRSGSIQILVSTTVVEVGIHVDNATIMAIYYPEFFGLSSLHQLRGRVGRSEKPGFCFLIAENELNKNQKEKLKLFENIEDGFKISELDLELRGEGNLFGKEQSGGTSLKRISDNQQDSELLEMAHKIANEIAEDSMELERQLWWFDKEEKEIFEHIL
jgi:ATP-dependent DNA helicase RecG